jgi:hypothetical protein
MGTSIDSKAEIDYAHFDKFIGYLVHLNNPRCIMLVCEPGLLNEAPINLKPNQGFFYRNTDKNIEIVLIDWLDDVSISQEKINKILMDAAVHVEIYSQYMAEEENSENIDTDVEI